MILMYDNVPPYPGPPGGIPGGKPVGGAVEKLYKFYLLHTQITKSTTIYGLKKPMCSYIHWQNYLFISIC